MNERVSGRTGEFYLEIYRIYSFAEPKTSSDNLSLGLYLISQAIKDLNIDYKRFPLNLPRLEDVPDMKEFPPGAPQSEEFENLAEILRQNPLLQLISYLDNNKIKTALSTGYNAESSIININYPHEIIYIEGENFHPEILNKIRFPKYNIETFFSGQEMEDMLRIREKRLEKSGKSKE